MSEQIRIESFQLPRLSDTETRTLRSSKQVIQLNAWISEGYKLFLEDHKFKSAHLQFYNEAPASGIFIRQQSLWNNTEQNLSYIQYLTELIYELDYVRINSDQKFKRGKLFQYRFYYKPKISRRMEGEQLYGNIEISLLLGSPGNYELKILVNRYQDSKFKNPLEFESFLTYVFS